MASQCEIKYSSIGLTEDENNLKMLESQWGRVAKVTPSKLSDSKGGAAQKTNEVIDKLPVSAGKSLSLISNTIAFFQNSGVKFEEGDKDAATTIQRIAN